MTKTATIVSASILGASLLAHVAIGAYAGLDDAVNDCVALESTVEPRAAIVDAYEGSWERYRQLYGVLKNYYHNWRTECPATVLV